MRLRLNSAQQGLELGLRLSLAIREAFQTGNGIVQEVCGIVSTPRKDDINIL